MTRVFVLLIFFFTLPLGAVEPDEILQDPLLETRARSISAGLRCLQCRNESIDESSADIARDLRLLVRERLLTGDSDTEVVEYVVARYGEFVLLKPNGRGVNLVLWLAGPTLLLVTLLILFGVQRRSHKTSKETTQLTTSEEASLRALLDDD